MTVKRLRAIPGIGVDAVGDAADAANDADLLRLENLDTDVAPPRAAIVATQRAAELDESNSYLPFQGHLALRREAARYVGAVDGRDYDPQTQCVGVAGGLNGVLNVLLATVEPGTEVVICDPIYAGLVNRIRLVGGIPRFVTGTATKTGWRIDPAELAAAVGPNTAAVLTMSPAMPTGAVLDSTHWDALAPVVDEHDTWIIHDAAMERLLFDGRAPASPANHPTLQSRTITIGSASKELRMIGWRVGWVVGPPEILADIELVGMANVVCQVGIAQDGVVAALSSPSIESDIAAFVDVLQQRRDVILDQLREYPCVAPHGGWSLLIDTAKMGVHPADASQQLFLHGKVAATPMSGWGPSGDRYLRLVVSHEPVERLSDLRDRFDHAFSGGRT